MGVLEEVDGLNAMHTVVRGGGIRVAVNRYHSTRAAIHNVLTLILALHCGVPVVLYCIIRPGKCRPRFTLQST